MKTRHPKAWTTVEEKLLREVHASNMFLKECVDLFPGRTERSIGSRMDVLKLGPRKHVRAARRSSIIWTVMESILKTGQQLTTRELADRLKCTHRHAWQLLKDRHELEEPLVHIAHWRRARAGDSECVWVEVWGYGDGPDAVKPKAPTHAEHVRIQYYRKKMRQGKTEANPFAVAMSQVILEAA